MENMDSERLNSAKDIINDLVEKMTYVDDSQRLIEEETYEMMKSADLAIGQSKEAAILLEDLSLCINSYMEQPTNEGKHTIYTQIKQMKALHDIIIETSKTQGIISRNMERYVVKRRELLEEHEGSISDISQRID